MNPIYFPTYTTWNKFQCCHSNLLYMWFCMSVTRNSSSIYGQWSTIVDCIPYPRHFLDKNCLQHSKLTLKSKINVNFTRDSNPGDVYGGGGVCVCLWLKPSSRLSSAFILEIKERIESGLYNLQFQVFALCSL